MSQAEEETRARLWRGQQAQRADAQRALDAHLAGSPYARAALAAKWEPLARWMAERHETEPLPEDPPLRGN